MTGAVDPATGMTFTLILTWQLEHQRWSSCLSIWVPQRGHAGVVNPVGFCLPTIELLPAFGCEAALAAGRALGAALLFGAGGGGSQITG